MKLLVECLKGICIAVIAVLLVPIMIAELLNVAVHQFLEACGESLAYLALKIMGVDPDRKENEDEVRN